MITSRLFRGLLVTCLLQLQLAPVTAVRGRRPPPPPREEAAIVAAANPPTPTSALTKVSHLALASLLAYAMDPLVEQCFNSTRLRYEKGEYQKTLVYAGLESVDWGAKAYISVLVVDVIQALLPKQWSLFPNANLFEVAPKVGLAVWASNALSSLKSMLFHKAVHGFRLGKLTFIDRLLDLSIGIGAVYNVLHLLQVDLGMGFKSLFAASGVSAIVFSLASKGIVEQIAGGLLLQAWDAIEVGEYVRLGDGTEGTVQYIGLVETELVGSDHVPVRVPNAQIIFKKVHMFSKVTMSQVKQTLRFKYADLPRLPQLLQDMKKTIADACANDSLSSSPQVVLTQYESDHIQVTVSASFNIKPGSPEFVQVRQKVLLAIADAVQQSQVEFAIPAIQYETKSSNARVLVA